jgi:SAM-dependent methyltransferase
VKGLHTPTSSKSADRSLRFLEVSDLRCPETGGPIIYSADTDDYVGPGGRRYGRISGIPSFLIGELDPTLHETYEAQADSGEISPKTVSYLSATTFWRTQALLMSLLRDERRQLKILDVGCGHGLMSSPLTAHHAVIGVDFSLKMLRLARGIGIDAIHADAMRLPFRDECFDAVICAGLIQVVEDRVTLLREMFRVTRPGGRLLVATINGDSLVRRGYRALLNAGLFRPPAIPVETYPKPVTLGGFLRSLVGLPAVLEDIGLITLGHIYVRPSAKATTFDRLFADTFVLAVKRIDRP